MAAHKKVTSLCSECGVVLRDGAASCPLCGHETGSPSDPATVVAAVEVESYQSNLRRLRAQLEDLRAEDREAS